MIDYFYETRKHVSCFSISQNVKCYSLQILDWLTTQRNPEYTGTDIGLICFLNVMFSQKYLKMV